MSGRVFLGQPDSANVISKPALLPVRKRAVKRNALASSHKKVRVKQLASKRRQPLVISPEALLLNAKGVQAAGEKPVVVDPYVARHLRPHQKEGVQFMYHYLPT